LLTPEINENGRARAVQKSEPQGEEEQEEFNSRIRIIKKLDGGDP
jgi:hypothetical protein